LSKRRPAAIQSIKHLGFDLILGLSRDRKSDPVLIDIKVLVGKPVLVVYFGVVRCAHLATWSVASTLGWVQGRLVIAYWTKLGNLELQTIVVTVRVFRPLCVFEGSVSRVRPPLHP
jgi:hypothetical protein